MNTDQPKDPAAVALGRKGGLARKAALSEERRSEIARKAAIARHSKKRKKKAKLSSKIQPAD